MHVIGRTGGRATGRDHEIHVVRRVESREMRLERVLHARHADAVDAEPLEPRRHLGTQSVPHSPVAGSPGVEELVAEHEDACRRAAYDVHRVGTRCGREAEVRRPEDGAGGDEQGPLGRLLPGRSQVSTCDRFRAQEAVD